MVSLKSLIVKGMISPRVEVLMQQPAVEAITLAFEDGWMGRVDEESFMFSDDFREILLFPHEDSKIDERAAIVAYGKALQRCVAASPHRPRHLLEIAHDCACGRVISLSDLHLQLERRQSAAIYTPIIVIILALLGVLYGLGH